MDIAILLGLIVLNGVFAMSEIAIVTARGNPALPFYFLFVERDGQYTLSGEGTGRVEFTRLAFDDLRRLSQQDIAALAKEASKAKPATQ